ncbi:MAG: TolC family protein [Spirosomaceae bacterium]|nr:TolC family protein [Spirosomataceae bacterium]
MKKILILHLMVINQLFAQKITLDDAIKIGLENRIEIKNQALQIQLAQSENDKIKAKWLPQISGSADVRWNTQLQTTVLPFSLTPGETTSKVQLGLPFNNTLGVQADQKVYDANKKIDRQINDTQTENQKNSLEQQQINIRQAITEAYYLAVFNKERIIYAQNQLDRNKVNLETADTRLKAGTILQNEYDRFKLDVSNAQISLQKAKQDFDLSLEALRYQMNSKSAINDLSDELADILKKADTNYQMMFEQRPEIRGEEISIRINELNVQKQKVRNLPTVSAYGNYSALQLSNKLNPFASGTWFPFNYVGIRANIPIFDGKQAKLASNDFVVRQQINRNNIEKFKADFGYEAQNAMKQVEQAKLDINETQKNVALAKQILETDKFRYEKGVLTIADLKNSEFSLQNAENNYLSSVYNFLVANVRYKKAIGNL